MRPIKIGKQNKLHRPIRHIPGEENPFLGPKLQSLEVFDLSDSALADVLYDCMLV
jgi:hypothetical protein